MQRRNLIQAGVAGLSLGLVRASLAESFLTIEEAQALIFPNAKLLPVKLTLSKEQGKAIQKRSGMRVRQLTPKLWRTEDQSWFWVDQVIGKHEFIDVALGINAQGQMTAIEILTYRESYGGEIRNPKWRAQFVGRTPAQVPMKLDQSIRNISGATLSCRHITDAANRWLATWDLVLQKVA